MMDLLRDDEGASSSDSVIRDVQIIIHRSETSNHQSMEEKGGSPIHG